MTPSQETHVPNLRPLKYFVKAGKRSRLDVTLVAKIVKYILLLKASPTFSPQYAPE